MIQQGQNVTKDLQPDRLNVTLNEDGTVFSVYHG